MNRERRTLWEQRHRGALPGDPEPSVAEMLQREGGEISRGVALDIACGTGRNTLALARAGLRVVAVDFSMPGLSTLGQIARREALAVTPVAADLEESFPFAPGSFDLIINVTYLDRELVPSLRGALRAGGMLLFDTFLIDEAGHGHLSNSRFTLEHYELRELLAGMELLRYREGLVEYPGGKRAWRASALARRRS